MTASAPVRANANGWMQMNFRIIAGASLAMAALAGVCLAQTDSPGDGGGPAHTRGAKVREACKADIQKFCADAEAGRPTFQCMRQHQDDLSDGCKSAMASMRGQWRGHPPQGQSDAPPTPPATGAPSAPN